jgi:hypothetical protein
MINRYMMYLFIMGIHIDRKVIGDVSVYHGSTLTLFLRISEKRQFPKLCKKSKLCSSHEYNLLFLQSLGNCRFSDIRRNRVNVDP